MNEIRELNRIARWYENQFKNDSSKIRKNLDFHIEQLEQVIETTKSALDVTSEEIEERAKTIQIVYEVDDANTWLQKLELKIMKWFVNWRYDKTLKYFSNLNAAKERIEKIMLRLLQIKALCK